MPLAQPVLQLSCCFAAYTEDLRYFIDNSDKYPFFPGITSGYFELFSLVQSICGDRAVHSAALLPYLFSAMSDDGSVGRAAGSDR